jgi:hypothetical protein
VTTPGSSTRPLSLTKWRRAHRIPSAADHAREDAFLENHIRSGALINQVSAEILHSAFASEADVQRREILSLRIYADYVSALEAMGAWGWAIRHRRDAPLLLDAFLSYEPGEVLRFFENVAEAHAADREVTTLLNLPPTQRITDELRRYGAPHAPLLADLNALMHNFNEAARHYSHPEAIFVATYNKAKHGAPIIKDPTLPEDAFLLVGPNRTAPVSDRYAFYKFQSSAEFVDRTLELVKWASLQTRALVNFILNVKKVGLLYDP